MWTNLTSSERTSILDSYHSAGIALMVSVFGDTVTPTTSKWDPITTAQDIANFTKTWGFDGVDVDYEDFDAFNAGTSSAWLRREFR